jgi:hypothetical protein
MYPLYKDIREKLGTPKWIDKHGVPRYSEATPKEGKEIYNNWVLLMEVKCQACQKTFLCCESINWVNINIRQIKNSLPMIDDTVENVLHEIFGWGDAPWHDADGNEAGFESQCAGTTMSTNCIAIGLWKKANHPSDAWLEVEIPEMYTKWEDEK